MCDIDFTVDEKSIIRGAIEALHREFVVKLGRDGSRAKTQPSKEMIAYLRKLDILLTRIRTGMWL